MRRYIVPVYCLLITGPDVYMIKSGSNQVFLRPTPTVGIVVGVLTLSVVELVPRLCGKVYTAVQFSQDLKDKVSVNCLVCSQLTKSTNHFLLPNFLVWVCRGFLLGSCWQDRDEYFENR